MSRSVQRPPIQGRGYSVRDVVSVGAGSGASVNCAPPPRPETVEGPPSPRPPPASPDRPEPVEGAPELVEADEGRAVARCCSIGAPTRALATSVSRPIWLC